METEMIWNLVFLGGIPLGIILYHWYMKATAADSPGGKNVTYDELVALVMDPDFWAAIKHVREQVEDNDG